MKWNKHHKPQNFPYRQLDNLLRLSRQIDSEWIHAWSGQFESSLFQDHSLDQDHLRIFATCLESIFLIDDHKLSVSELLRSIWICYTRLKCL